MVADAFRHVSTWVFDLDNTLYPPSAGLFDRIEPLAQSVQIVVVTDRNAAAAWAQYPHLKRLLDEINARPAAARVEALRQRHSFKTEMDDQARRAMFPQNERLSKA